MDVIEEITMTQVAAGAPAQPTSGIDFVGMELVTLWARSDANVPEKVKVRVVLQSPDRKRLFEPEQVIDLTKNVRNRHIVRTSGLPFTVPGQYHWIVEAFGQTKSGREKWRPVTKVPYDVKLVQATSEKSSGPPKKKTSRKRSKSRARTAGKRKA